MEPSVTMLTPREAAQRLSLHTVTLARWRQQGRGPAWCKLGAAVRYPVADLERYVGEVRQGGASTTSPRQRAP